MRNPTTQLHRTGGRPLRYLGLSGLADGDERCDVARGRLPVGMWQRANHRPDDRRCLIDTIRPCRHEVADIVIDPSFAVDISAALKPSMIGIAVGVVASERQTPAGTAERSGHLPEHRLGQGEGPCAETQGIEGDGKVRVVLEASVAPGADKRRGHRGFPSSCGDALRIRRAAFRVAPSTCDTGFRRARISAAAASGSAVGTPRTRSMGPTPCETPPTWSARSVD